MEYIELKNITNHYGTTKVLDNVSLSIAQGTFHTLLGPSGCGKTTLLGLLGGFLGPTAGSIWLDGREITHLPPEKRDMGIVFQSYALFPNLTVEENVAYGLKLRHTDRATLRRICEEFLELVGLTDFRARRIQELSGGQQQRVAIARALAIRPKVLLLDEPMSNLDVSLRLKMREEIRRIQRAVGITTLFITHDQQEALSISDTVSVMNGGKIEQTGTPRQIYEHPGTAFTAAFVGKTNRLEPEALSAWGIFGTEPAFVRPEQFRLHRQLSNRAPVAGTVRATHYQGSVVEYEIGCAQGTLAVLCLNDRTGTPGPGDTVYLELCQ